MVVIAPRVSQFYCNLHFTFTMIRSHTHYTYFHDILSSTVQAQPTLFPIVTFMGVQASVKHGINDSSIPFFVGFGAMLW